VSESYSLGPIDYLNDIENLVSFERVMFEDCSFKYRTKIFLFLCQYHHLEVNAWSTVNGVQDKYKGDTFFFNKFGVNLMI